MITDTYEQQCNDFSLFGSPEQEAYLSELNAYDDNAERYASSTLDPEYEAFCDIGRYTDEFDGLSFEEYKALPKAPIAR